MVEYPSLSNVRITYGSIFHLSSVYGRKLMYVNPCLTLRGNVWSSRVAMHCVPPETLIDLPFTSF